MNSFLNRFINKTNIHLDFASTTPVDPFVYKKMKPYFKELFFNPSSSYRDAEKVKKDIKKHRISIARFFQVKENEIIFTQGGTESNNLAIIGLAKWVQENCDFIPHMLFSSIEHPAVSECIPELQKMGVEVEVVPVTQNGKIKLETLEEKLTERTILVSAIFVSNEIGTIEPIHKIASLIKKFKNKLHRSFIQFPYLHTDASQAVLTQNVDISKIGADLISIDGSKIYAPKMSGILIKKQFVKIQPLVFGGGQEYGLRSGTEHAASIIGISTALTRIEHYQKRDIRHFSKLKNIFINQLQVEKIPYILNGFLVESVPNILNICIEGLDSDFAVIQMDELGVNCSAMTACASAKGVPKSDVLIAIGNEKCAQSSLRFSFGRITKPSEIKKAVKILKKVCQKQKLV